MTRVKMIPMKNSFGVVTDYKCGYCDKIIHGRGKYCDNCGSFLELVILSEQFHGIVFDDRMSLMGAIDYFRNRVAFEIPVYSTIQFQFILKELDRLHKEEAYRND